MSELRRSVIHAAVEAGDHELAERLMFRRNVSYRTLIRYARHYGI